MKTIVKRLTVTVMAVFLTACGAPFHYRSEPNQTARPQPAGRGSRGAAIATPPAIRQQPLIRAIHNWGGEVAVITEPWISSAKGSIYSLATVDPGGSRIVPFRAISCDSYDDVGYSEQIGKIVVCGRSDGARLYRQTPQGWMPLSDAVLGKEFRCAVDRNRIALISDEAVYLFSMGSSKPSSRISIGFKKLPGDFTGPMVPAAALLSETSILLGYDEGEFGGALYRVNFSQPTTPVKLLDDNVKFLARSPSGAVWAGAGLGHLGGEHAALYRIDGPEPRVVASVSGYLMENGPRISEKSGAEFPALTTLNGLAFGDSDRPIVVFPQLGVFEYGDDRFNARYNGSLSFEYQDSLRGLRIAVLSLPVGVVAAGPGDLYVATRSLGVLRIRDRGQAASIKQLTFGVRQP